MPTLGMERNHQKVSARQEAELSLASTPVSEKFQLDRAKR